MGGEGKPLRGAKVLVLEDDYYLATDLRDTLEAHGATVIGPFGDTADAEKALAGALPDCAFIDVNLGDGPSFAMPRALAQRNVPFAFVTGYDAATIPDEFAAAPRVEKPAAQSEIVRTAAMMLGATALPS